MYPLVRELAVDEIRVALTGSSNLPPVPRPSYDRWLASPATDAKLTVAYRANALFWVSPRIVETSPLRT